MHANNVRHSSLQQLSELDFELNAKRNRIIVVNRHEPIASWSVTDYPTEHFRWPHSIKCRLSSKRREQNKLGSQVLEANFDSGPFPTNEWRSSKYTLLNFLPKNLFEQFRRVANFYFLVSAILQIIIPFSPVGPATSLLPLIFVVSTTAMKQAYEDFLRHKMDSEINNRLCQVLRQKKLTKIRSKDIRVGDIVYVRNNEEIPCDMVLLAASGHGDRCYVTTANLDGETNLKSRTCFQIKEKIGSIEELDNSLLVVEYECPNATLYEFNGHLRSPKTRVSYENLLRGLKRDPSETSQSDLQENISYVAQVIMSRLRQNHSLNSNKHEKNYHDGVRSSENHEVPLDISNLLLRASRLRNTAYVYGLVVYTGKDTKLAQNSHVKPNKFSSMESKVNIFLLIAFIILSIFTLTATLRYTRPKEWQYVGLGKSDSFEQILVAHFLLYNYIVPISLYVTLEFVKFFGTVSVVNDEKMQVTVWQTIPNDSKRSLATSETSNINVEKTNGPILSKSNAIRVQRIEGARCNSSDLNEELGQVEVLFSDKTGTLTENKMRFMVCSAYGQMYRSVQGRLFLQPANLFRLSTPKVAEALAQVETNRYAFLAANGGAQLFNNPVDRSGQVKSTYKPFDHRFYPPLDNFHAIDDLEKNEEVVNFFICLCLCSTITLNETETLEDCMPDKTLNEYDFQSASPDEESLISAAHLFGITMCKSNDRECYIVIKRSSKNTKPVNRMNIREEGKFDALVETENSTEKYIVRHFERKLVFEFNSTRKRMSVIYRDCDNNCMLMVTKGSEELLDCIDMKQLNSRKEQMIDVTMAHFEAFAKSGLRTMLVAMKIFETTDYEKIETEMSEARLSMHQRDYLLSKLYHRAENDLILIGTTAVEDTLQEGVPETIANLKAAGIKVWLLTGDKVETAISVAYLCKLLDQEMSLFHLVRQRDAETCKSLLLSYCKQLKLSKRQTEFKLNSVTLTSKSLKSIRSYHRFALIADGRSLHFAMKHAKKELAQLSRHCVCVLGCRLSPLQKAEIVDMIKKTAERPITAAIGDGANDISMIQEAHVGIGVCGKEGKQAVNCSDFAINRFRMLNRLLFVHGHLLYHRTANTIHYFFYKNMLFILPQFLYSFYNLSSAHSLYHPVQLISFNLFFTSLPILVYGLSEIHVPENVLENYPKLYMINRHNKQLRMSVFFSWLSLGAFQAFVAFYMMLFNWGSHTPFLESGKMAGIHGFSVILYFVITITATIKLYFLAEHWSLGFHLSCFASCTLLPLFFYTYSLIDWSLIINNNSYYGQYIVYLASPMFWLAVMSTTSATVLPNIIWFIIGHMTYHRKLVSVLNPEKM